MPAVTFPSIKLCSIKTALSKRPALPSSLDKIATSNFHVVVVVLFGSLLRDLSTSYLPRVSFCTPPHFSRRLKNLTAEDLLVYQVIQASGNMGIWTRDMKTRTNLAQPKINKILKTLEERNLVKSVKSVQNSSRKVYMLAELEPAKELTGGPWYSDNQNVDEEFISTLRDVARRFISASDGPRSLEEIADWIGKSV